MITDQRVTTIKSVLHPTSFPLAVSAEMFFLWHQCLTVDSHRRQSGPSGQRIRFFGQISNCNAAFHNNRLRSSLPVPTFRGWQLRRSQHARTAGKPLLRCAGCWERLAEVWYNPSRCRILALGIIVAFVATVRISRTQSIVRVLRATSGGVERL